MFESFQYFWTEGNFVLRYKSKIPNIIIFCNFLKFYHFIYFLAQSGSKLEVRPLLKISLRG